jgi:hypothetical protein
MRMLIELPHHGQPMPLRNAGNRGGRRAQNEPRGARLPGQPLVPPKRQDRE